MEKTGRSAMLGTMKMGRLIPKVSLPIMVSMLVQAMYNVVDSICISRDSLNGLTAVSLVFPFQMLMIALSTGMGTGLSSLLGRRLGEKRGEDARRAAWNGMLIEIAGALLFILAGLFLARPFMGMVIQEENFPDPEAIREMGIQYLSIVTIWSPGLFLAIYFERMLQSTGNTVQSMITQLVGAVTNIILDPVLIFVFHMGISGAAIATVIGQWVSAGVGFCLNQWKNTELRLHPKEFKVSRKDLGAILAVGFPSTIMAAIGSVMNLGMNAILSGFAEQSQAALNVFAIYFKLQSFVFMPVFGLSSGVIAILAYNYGARLKERVYQCIKLALLWAVSILGVGMIIFMAFPQLLMSIFESNTNDPKMADTILLMGKIGPVAMRVISLSFIPAAIGIMLSTLFQAVGKGFYSMIISICRQLVVLVPVAWLLARLTGSVYAVWWSFPIAEIFTLGLCLLFYWICNKKMLSRL